MNIVLFAAEKGCTLLKLVGYNYIRHFVRRQCGCHVQKFRAKAETKKMGDPDAKKVLDFVVKNPPVKKYCKKSVSKRHFLHGCRK